MKFGSYEYKAIIDSSQKIHGVPYTWYFKCILWVESKVERSLKDPLGDLFPTFSLKINTIVNMAKLFAP